MADSRHLRGVAATLSWQNYDEDGNVAAPVGAVTVGATRADGTTLVASGTATAGTTTAPRTLALTAAQTATLDLLTATWTDAGDSSVHTTTHEIVGGYYLSIPQIRAIKNLDNAATFTAAELEEARAWFEDTFERFTGVAWVRRYARAWVNGNGLASLLLDYQQIRSVRSLRAYSDATTYTAFTAPELADLRFKPWGTIERGTLGYFTAGSSNLLIEIEHGYDEPPSDVVQAAKVGIRDYLLTQNSGNRVYSVQTQDGIIRSSTPGADRPFGVPEVDAVAVARSHRAPAVA